MYAKAIKRSYSFLIIVSITVSKIPNFILNNAFFPIQTVLNWHSEENVEKGLKLLKRQKLLCPKNAPH
jgi:hypothetical protein